MTDLNGETNWSEVIAKCLAYLCLNTDEAKKKTGVLDRVEFLERLGLPIASASLLVGSTPASVRELQRVARNKKSGDSKSNAKKSKRKKG